MLEFDGYCRGNVGCFHRSLLFLCFQYLHLLCISTGTLESTQHLLQLDDITNFDIRYVCEMVVISLVFSNLAL